MLRMNLPLLAQELDITCGAVCFESMMRFFQRPSEGEMNYAEKLQTFYLGFTAPENIVKLAIENDLHSELLVGASFEELKRLFSPDQVLYITWWDEDAGHYSLVEELGEDHIVLMDPWYARKGEYHRLEMPYFLTCWAQRGSKIIRIWI